MGFAESLGRMIGKMGVQAQEMQGYKSEYETFSERELKAEYNRLRSRGSSEEMRLRKIALTQVLKDRGYIQS